MKTLDDLDFKGKIVLLRSDLNVSLNDEGQITDDSRIRSSIPTLKYLLEEKKASKVVLMSHLGRPNGKLVQSLKMDSVANRLSELLKTKVLKIDDCIGQKQNIEFAREKVIVLENLRFYPQEEKNDPEFAKKIAEQGDIYVNDAFGASHRAHSSVEAITKFLPSAAGLLLEAEISALTKAMNPTKPFVLVLGGAKVSDKIGMIESLSKNADFVLIGGAMAFTFLKSEGIGIGKSKFEQDKLEVAKRFLSEKLVLPIDFLAAEKIDSHAKATAVHKVPPNYYGLDIGPETVDLFISKIKQARTIVWNGPMGMFEIDEFGLGTKKIGNAIAATHATTIVGGGDTLAAIQKYHLGGYTFVSTGGGAMLEFLEGKKLPAIEALER